MAWLHLLIMITNIFLLPCMGWLYQPVHERECLLLNYLRKTWKRENIFILSALIITAWLEYVQVELSARKTWITLERKQLHIRGLHYWKARAEAVKNIPSVNSKTGEKVLFQNSIQKSMGIEKTTGFPLKTRPLLVTRYGSIDHADCLH